MHAKTPNDLHLPPPIVEVTFEFVLDNFLCQFRKIYSSRGFNRIGEKMFKI